MRSRWNLFLIYNSLKNLATLYFRYPELRKQKSWRLSCGRKPGMQVYGLQLISLDIIIRKKSGSICLKPLNGWRKGWLYCESYCAYELALIYLYNDEYKNVERGLMCLQRCVDDNYVEAIETLANVYFNGELVGREYLVCLSVVGESYRAGVR